MSDRIFSCLWFAYLFVRLRAAHPSDSLSCAVTVFPSVSPSDSIRTPFRESACSTSEQFAVLASQNGLTIVIGSLHRWVCSSMMEYKHKLKFSLLSAPRLDVPFVPLLCPEYFYKWDSLCIVHPPKSMTTMRIQVCARNSFHHSSWHPYETLYVVIILILLFGILYTWQSALDWHPSSRVMKLAMAQMESEAMWVQIHTAYMKFRNSYCVYEI